MGRKLSLLLLVTILIYSLSLPVMALPDTSEAATETVTIEIPSATGDSTQLYQESTDVAYSGPLDPLTGLPAEDTNSTSVSYESLKTGSFEYDKEQSCFINNVGSQSFTSNVPNGSILSKGKNSVSLTVPNGLVAELYCNGELRSGADLSYIAEAGAYILEVSGSNSDESVSFSFRILDEKTNAVTEFSLPSGFTFETILLDGEILAAEYQNYVQLIEDGAYEIRWVNKDINQRYTTSFTLDTVAPVLELPEVENGEAHSEVTLTDLESDAYIVLKDVRSGETEKIASANTKIEKAGTYILTVYDAAGNSTTYEFTIHVYLNVSAFAAICLVAAAAIGLLVYSNYIKKHPRVG